jgi:hypothetical protein
MTNDEIPKLSEMTNDETPKYPRKPEDANDEGGGDGALSDARDEEHVPWDGACENGRVGEDGKFHWVFGYFVIN